MDKEEFTNKCTQEKNCVYLFLLIVVKNINVSVNISCRKYLNEYNFTCGSWLRSNVKLSGNSCILYLLMKSASGEQYWEF